MSSDEIAIQVHQVCKSYQIYGKPQHRLWQGIFGGRRQFYKEFWALRDISFEVKKGEVVGIIGCNGSGKSTLLQIISGTLNPSSAGKLVVRGRVAALLELGAGFSPEFSGKENVFMNASLLGLTHQEIEERYQDIVDFADIHDFIDQPVKIYSSGMYARLAFAVAISVDPAILIIDEALSVGDEAFQRKCFGRIEEIRKKGTSILFVSHSPGVITELCDRAILLDHGELLLAGEPKYVLSRYQRLVYASADRLEEIRCELRAEMDQSGQVRSFSSELKLDERQRQYVAEDYFDPSLRSQTIVEYLQRGCEIVNTMIVNSAEQKANVLRCGELYRFVYEVEVSRPVYNVRFGMLIKSVSGVEIGGMTSHPLGESIAEIAPGVRLSVEFFFKAILTPGMYFMNAGILGNVDGEETFLHRIVDAMAFRVQPDQRSRATGYVDFSQDPVCRVIQ